MELQILNFMNKPTYRSALTLLGIAIVLFITYNNIFNLINYHSSILQWDEWSVFNKYTKYLGNNSSLFEFIWSQHNEHRPIIANLLFYIGTSILKNYSILQQILSLIHI